MKLAAAIGCKEIIASSGSLKIKVIKFIDYYCGSLIAFFVSPRKTTAALDPRAVRRILVIRPGGIGDAVFLLPILRSLKSQDKSRVIDILCEKRNHQVFSSQEDTHDKTYCYDDPKSFKEVTKNKYDLVIDTEQWHYLSALVARFLTRAHGQAVGFATRPFRTKLFHFPINYDIDAYEMENFKKLFKPISFNLEAIENINNCFFVKDELLAWTKKKIPQNSISIFVGASIPERRLTLIQIQEIVQFILKKDFAVILLGGTDVQTTGDELDQKIKDPLFYNFVGKTSLQESVALIKMSKVFIGADSGLMHLACAAGTPTIGIFGPGNLKKWTIKGNQHTVITLSVECSPCTRYGYTIPTCKGSYHCMRKLDILKILETRRNLIPKL